MDREFWYRDEKTLGEQAAVEFTMKQVAKDDYEQKTQLLEVDSGG